MTPEDEELLKYFRALGWTEGWDREDYFTAGWRAAMKYAKEQKEQWELSSHRKD